MLPYKKQTSVNKPDATAVVIELDFPNRCSITSLLAKRVSGAGEITFDLFDQDPDDHDGTTNPELVHKVVPAQTSVGGEVSYFPEAAQPFFNQDSTVRRKLYVRLSGAGTGDWFVAVAGVSPLI